MKIKEYLWNEIRKIKDDWDYYKKNKPKTTLWEIFILLP